MGTEGGGGSDKEKLNDPQLGFRYQNLSILSSFSDSMSKRSAADFNKAGRVGVNSKAQNHFLH